MSRFPRNHLPLKGKEYSFYLTPGFSVDWHLAVLKTELQGTSNRNDMMAFVLGAILSCVVLPNRLTIALGFQVDFKRLFRQRQPF